MTHSLLSSWWILVGSAVWLPALGSAIVEAGDLSLIFYVSEQSVDSRLAVGINMPFNFLPGFHVISVAVVLYSPRKILNRLFQDLLMQLVINDGVNN